MTQRWGREQDNAKRETVPFLSTKARCALDHSNANDNTSEEHVMSGLAARTLWVPYYSLRRAKNIDGLSVTHYMATLDINFICPLGHEISCHDSMIIPPRGNRVYLSSQRQGP